MTQLLEKAFRKARALPPDEQDRLARRWLKDLDTPTPSVPNEQDAASAYDLIKQFVGTGEGPEDLSTNPKYLEDLGKSSTL